MMGMRYVYTHTGTSQTTGYFECVPDPEPDLKAGLFLLEERPMDAFLRRYLLRRLLALDVSQLSGLVNDAVNNSLPQAAGLLHEALAINGCVSLLPVSCLDQLVALIEKTSVRNGLPAPAAPFLSGKEDREFLERLRGNIHSHCPLPSSEIFPLTGELEAAWRTIDARRGTLDNCFESVQSRTAGATPCPGPSLREIYALVNEIIVRNGLAAGPEMRHEASLSPIALLRSWHLNAGVHKGRNYHDLTGIATAYGRGLSLAAARVSCAMEIIERASAHIVIGDGAARGATLPGYPPICESWLKLEAKGIKALDPSVSGWARRETTLHWVAGETARGEVVYVPAQAVYLFCNLEEPPLFANAGSTGLAAGVSVAGARLAALLEIIERDAHATMPFRKEDCFELAARDPVTGSLLEDYRWRGIQVQFQDITSELGVPVYRCFVHGGDGRIAQATGAGLNGAKAAIAAMTETPWPYVWANPVRAPSGAGIPDLPIRMLEDLPDYSCPDAETCLSMLESALGSMGITPVYVNLTREEYHFPVYRAFAPGLEVDPELENGASPRLLARLCHQKGML